MTSLRKIAPVKYLKYGYSITLALFICMHTNAQLSLSGQLRLRNEFRDGYGSPLPKGADPAFFIVQRTRLNMVYSIPRLKFGVSVQDVRVWGQDVSTVNTTTAQNENGFMLQQAWAEILLSDTASKNNVLSLKVGRQELYYDDQRLIGTSDWTPQGRRFDAGLLKYELPGWSINLAGAFNQNEENNSGTIYNPVPPGNYAASTNGGEMYKSLEFLHVSRKLRAGSASFLFFSDQFSQYVTDTVNQQPVKTYKSSTWARFTTGFYFSNLFQKTQVTASAYYQFGKTSVGQKVSAVLFSGFVQYLFNQKYSAGIGVDYTSGGKSGSTSNVFDPLYGSPHGLWGLIDYYYDGTLFGTGGLVDYYIKTKVNLSGRSWLTIDFHQYSSAQKINGSKNFGQEADGVYHFALSKDIGLEAGYAHYWSTALLTSKPVKNVPDAKSNSNWAYIQLNITPDFIFKKQTL